MLRIAGRGVAVMRASRAASCAASRVPRGSASEAPAAVPSVVPSPPPSEGDNLDAFLLSKLACPLSKEALELRPPSPASSAVAEGTRASGSDPAGSVLFSNAIGVEFRIDADGVPRLHVLDGRIV